MLVHYVLPIRRCGYSRLQDMIHGGMLLPDPHARLQQGPLRGDLYTPMQGVLLSAASDWLVHAGGVPIPVDLYRLPTAEYASVVRGTTTYAQPPGLAEVTQALATHHLAPAALSELLERMSSTSGETRYVPEERAFSATWHPERWACLRRRNDFFLVVWFDLAFRLTSSVSSRTEIALDLGAAPLVCATSGTFGWSVPDVHTAALRRLKPRLSAQAALLLERAQYEAQRERLAAFTGMLCHHATVVYAEDLEYGNMERQFVQWARQSGLIDWHEAWMPNRLAAAGVPLEKVDARGTSARCSACQWPHGLRRGAQYECPNCGQRMDAHQNAARNVLSRGRLKSQSWEAAHRRTRQRRGA